MLSVLGAVSHPRMQLKSPYLVDPTGGVHVLPGAGGITYNVAVGDSVFAVAGDHVEPGVSITLDEKERDGAALAALSVLSCIGNEARVVSGHAVHARGVVTGKHGGIEHVIIDFPPAVLDKLAIGDRIQIRAFGQGLKLRDMPDVQVMNVDPSLLQKMGIVGQGAQLVVPVTHVFPASIMGSGTGSRHSFSGDYDIQTTDRDIVQRYGLQNLRIGDVVAVRDADCRFGRSMRTDAVSIGVIVHASCVISGHGPGVTVIMTTAKKLITPKIEPEANIARYLGIGRSPRAAAQDRTPSTEQRPRSGASEPRSRRRRR
jgi:hypothetical protein